MTASRGFHAGGGCWSYCCCAVAVAVSYYLPSCEAEITMMRKWYYGITTMNPRLRGCRRWGENQHRRFRDWVSRSFQIDQMLVLSELLKALRNNQYVFLGRATMVNTLTALGDTAYGVSSISRRPRFMSPVDAQRILRELHDSSQLLRAENRPAVCTQQACVGTSRSCPVPNSSPTCDATSRWKSS